MAYNMSSSSGQPQLRYTQTPSKVLHLRNLPWECTEEELVELGKPFGKIVNTKSNVGADLNQAFVEFADLNQAISMVSYYASSSDPAQVRGKTVYIQYSNRQEIVDNKSTGDVAGNVLLVTIEGVEAGDVSIDVIHLVFSALGFVHKIATFEKATGFQVLIQFTDAEIAAAARNALDGRIIPRYLLPEHFSSSHLRVSYSAHTDLNIKCQSHRSRNVILSDLTKLMSCLNLSVDSYQFSCFYDFVFYVFCENGQKNITVKKAVTAWRLVLAGRFRLLNQWCSFVEEHQRHNISADTWQQVLAFSRCVNEDLDGYDPKGAWPVLVDDFVEHMYRINQSNSCNTEFNCSCSDMQADPDISSTFRGLNLLPGSKRKFYSGSNECREETEGSLINKFIREETEGSLINKLKRSRHSLVPRRRGCLDSNIVDEGLAKGLERHLLIGCSFQFEHKGSYT